MSFYFGTLSSFHVRFADLKDGTLKCRPQTLHPKSPCTLDPCSQDRVDAAQKTSGDRTPVDFAMEHAPRLIGQG